MKISRTIAVAATAMIVAVVGACTSPSTKTEQSAPVAQAVPNTDVIARTPAQSNSCVDVRFNKQTNRDECWRKVDGKWKDQIQDATKPGSSQVMTSKEICDVAGGRDGCRAEWRKGGGCWRKCGVFGGWKDQLPEVACQQYRCGQEPQVNTGGNDTGGGSGGWGNDPQPAPTNKCCAAMRGGDCFRKCDGKWKDLLPRNFCSGDTDPNAYCHAEYRTGGGCWMRCGGKWKDLLPDESACQVRICQ